MTTTRISILPAFAAVVMLTGCVHIVEPQPTGYWNVSPAEAVGALAGGALGGYLGAQFGAGTGALAMTGLGATAGAALGRELGRSLESPNRPPGQPSIVVPYGQCLRPSNEAPSGQASQAPNQWSLSPC
jgi:hypothetical protein